MGRNISWWNDFRKFGVNLNRPFNPKLLRTFDMLIICIVTKREQWYILFPKLLCLLYGVHWRTLIEWSPPECWCSGENILDISKSHFYVDIPKGLQSFKSKKYNFNNRISSTWPAVGDILDLTILVLLKPYHIS